MYLRVILISCWLMCTRHTHPPVESGGGSDNGTSLDQRNRLPACGSLIDVYGVAHRLLAYVDDRVLLTTLDTHHPCLTQDVDGSIQLPTVHWLLDGMVEGSITPHRPVTRPSPTEKLRFEIAMLDAAGVPQGDKCIWQFLAKAWTPDLVERFGEHDDPWRIRRWRSAIRKAARKGDGA